MSTYYLRINGFDVYPYIAHNGLKRTRNDVDGPNAGRTLDGLMHRDRVATKLRYDVTIVPLKGSELGQILDAIHPEYVSVSTNIDPQGSFTKQFYSNNNPATAMMEQPDGSILWSSISFPLVEV